MIRGQASRSTVLWSERGPGNLASYPPVEQMDKTEKPVVDPDTPRTVLDEGSRIRAGDRGYGREPAVLKIGNPVPRRDPNSLTSVLQEGKNVIVRQCDFGRLAHAR